MTHTATAGKAYGHVPGHTYHDVTITLRSRLGLWSATATEVTGCCQGYRPGFGELQQQHSCKTVREGGHQTIESALRAIERKAIAAGMPADYVRTACAEVVDEVDSVVACYT